MLNTIRSNVVDGMLYMYTKTLASEVLELETGQNTGFKQHGGLTVTANPEMMVQFQREVDVTKYTGNTAVMVTPEQCKEQIKMWFWLPEKLSYATWVEGANLQLPYLHPDCILLNIFKIILLCLSASIGIAFDQELQFLLFISLSPSTAYLIASFNQSHLIWISDQDIFPHLNISTLLGGIYSETDGSVDPTSLTNAYATGATNNGVKIVTGCPVDDILVKNDKVVGVRTSSGDEIISNSVVVTAGAWSDLLTRNMA